MLADASEWSHDPWSGDVADGFLWGRGSIDMKSQVAAEAVAAAALARQGWRPTAGTLKLVFIADEETGGEVGARWITSTHPDQVRCDMLINEGAGESFEYRGRRHYGVCCAEKGIFRFSITALGAAGHASLPRHRRQRAAQARPGARQAGPPAASRSRSPRRRRRCSRSRRGSRRPGRGDGADRRDEPRLRTLVEPMFGVTLTPTMADASSR